MAEHTLLLHTKPNASISDELSAHAAISQESDLFRPLKFLHRNIRTFLRHHAEACKTQTTPAIGSGLIPQQPAAARITPDSDTTADESLADLEEHNKANSLLDAVSKDTLMVKTMDPDFESARRSVRHLTHRAFDDDEAELILAPISIRKKINFAYNRPTEEARPRKKIKTDKTVQRTKCHCTLTIWDNRDGLEETAAALVEKHTSCLATWSRFERTGHVVDLEPDKPFRLRAGDLKVPTLRDGESILAISDNYFMELKIWPTKEGIDWPPIPLLGKSDGDVNRPNRSAHTVLSGSLVAKFNNLPKQPDKNTPLSIFYLDQSGVMLRTKYGLEVHGEWHASKTKIKESLGPLNNELAWAVDDSNQFLGRKKRRRADSSPKTPQRRRKTFVKSPKRNKCATLGYLWEPDPSNAHRAQNECQTTEFEGLGCPACPTYDAQDLWELRFHFLSAHARFNFALEDEEYNHDTGDLVRAFFRVTSTRPPRKERSQRDDGTLLFQAKSTPFDLRAYLQGDTSWTGESRPIRKSRTRGAPQIDSTRATIAPRIAGFVPDPLIEIRARNNGHLPPEHVPEFRKPDRQKHKPITLIRHTDNKTQCYDSISHRPTDPSEEPMSETDDERDDEWYIQRHLEILDVDAEEFNRNDMKQELFRRWDRHRLEEQLDHVAFISESLVRFVKCNRRWLKQANADLKQAFGAFTGSLLSDRLIDPQVEGYVRAIIWRDASNLGAETVASSTGAGNTDTEGHATTVAVKSSDNNSTRSTSNTYEPVDPKTALEKWHAHLLAQPPNHCGVCTSAIANPPDTSILCTARKCKTPDVRFHYHCVKITKNTIPKLGKRNPSDGWVCMGCRLEATEAARATIRQAAKDVDRLEQGNDKESGEGEGKGKERARDGFHPYLYVGEVSGAIGVAKDRRG